MCICVTIKRVHLATKSALLRATVSIEWRKVCEEKTLVYATVLCLSGFVLLGLCRAGYSRRQRFN